MQYLLICPFHFLTSNTSKSKLLLTFYGRKKEEVKSIGNPAGIGKGTGFGLRERDRDGIGLGHYRLRATLGTLCYYSVVKEVSQYELKLLM